mgnify:CR=1 FL=1
MAVAPKTESKPALYVMAFVTATVAPELAATASELSGAANVTELVPLMVVEVPTEEYEVAALMAIELAPVKVVVPVPPTCEIPRSTPLKRLTLLAVVVNVEPLVSAKLPSVGSDAVV